jgi:hypothetical protein
VAETPADGDARGIGPRLSWVADGVQDYDNPLDAGANNTYVVTIRATDAASNTTDQTITVTVAQVNSLPANTISPVVSGIPQAGETLSVTSGTWTGYPSPTFTYQWYATAIAIPGATNTTYLLTAAEVGTYVGVYVTATNIVGENFANSNIISNILPADSPTIGTSVGLLLAITKAA